MSAIAEMIESVKRVDALLSDADLEPRPERDDWPSARKKLDALRTALAEEIEPRLRPTLEEAEDELATMIRRRTAHLYADAAAVLQAAGDGLRAAELLAKAERVSPDDAHRAELAAAQKEPAIFTRLVLSRWLLHDGRFADADREAKRVRRETKQPAFAGGAKKILRSPRPLTGSPPSLFTINGVGAGLYGSRDRDGQGTYVATYCICVLFIPIFPLAAYRVMRVGEQGYRFFAKEPLSIFARGVQIAFAAALALAIGGAALNSHLTSPEHRSEVALEEARKVEQAGKGDEAMEAYRRIVEEFPAGLDSVKAAADGVARLAAKEIPSPCTTAAVEPARRASNAFLSLPASHRGAARPTELVKRLDACATEIGDAGSERARAALRVLDLASDVAEGTADAAWIEERRGAARRAFASTVAESRPLLALAELSKLEDAESVAAAKKIILDLGTDGSLWVDAEADIERWSKHTRAQGGQGAGDVLAKLARAMEEARKTDVLIAAGDQKAIEKAAAEQPANQALAVAVAGQMRSRGDAKGALDLLAKLGPPGRLTGAAQEALANAHADTGAPAKADEILSALLDERLPAFQDAQRAYFEAADAVQQRVAADLQRGAVPPELERRVAAAFDDAKKREEVQAWISSRIEMDPSLASVRAEYLKRGGVVSAALSLGMVKLRRAADARGDERKQLLSEAERAFLAIRSEASGDPSFHLALGQVYFRLGKTEEGDKEIQSVLERGTPALSLAVARTYRELGLNSRARKVARDTYDKASEEAARHGAASLLAHMAADLEEEEQWYRKSDLLDPDVRIGLDRVEGERLLRDGKAAEADRKFKQCAEHFAKEAKTRSISANNAATETMRRYAATGDPAHLQTAAGYLETAMRLEPDNALILGNLSESLAHLGFVTVLSKWVDTRSLVLSGRASKSLASSMLDGPLSADLLDALRKDPSFQRALEISRKLQVLAPQMPGAYRLHISWYAWTDDVKALEDLQKRVDLLPGADADADVREQWQSGERDAEALKAVKAEVAQARRRVDLVKNGSKPTQAVAWGGLADALLSWVYFERDIAALDEAAEAVRKARSLWPEGVTARDAGSTLFGVAFHRALDASPALKKAWEQGRRKHSSLVVAHLAASAEGGAEVAPALRKEPAFTESVALFKTAAGARPHLTDWLLARLAGDPELERAAAKVFERRDSELGHAIDAKLDPDDEDTRVMLELFRSRGAPR